MDQKEHSPFSIPPPSPLSMHSAHQPHRSIPSPPPVALSSAEGYPMDATIVTMPTSQSETPDPKLPENAEEYKPVDMELGARASKHFCQDGFTHDYRKVYTLCGVLWLIFCFPCGLICCYLNAEERCIKCNQLGPKK